VNFTVLAANTSLLQSNQVCCIIHIHVVAGGVAQRQHASRHAVSTWVVAWHKGNVVYLDQLSTRSTYAEPG